MKADTKISEKGIYIVPIDPPLEIGGTSLKGPKNIKELLEESSYEDDLLQSLLELDNEKLEIRFPCKDEKLEGFYSKGCDYGKELWDLKGYEDDWEDFWEDLNFLSKESDFYWMKKFEKRVYMDIFRDYLSEKEDLKVLDAGGGIGRFTIELGKRFENVVLLDWSKNSLKAALENVLGNGCRNIEFQLGRLEDLPFEKDEFDLTFAIESICYSPNQRKKLQELKRVTKNNGRIFISTENKYSVPFLKYFSGDPGKIFEGENSTKDRNYTKYLTPKNFRNIIKNAGFKILKFENLHFLVEGPFNFLVDQDKLPREEYRNRLFEFEKKLQRHEAYKTLGRVICAVVENRKRQPLNE